MKSKLIIFLSIIFSFCVICTKPVLAQDSEENNTAGILLTIGSPYYDIWYLNNYESNNNQIDPIKAVVPVIVNNRTMVPVRLITEAFGGEIEWSKEEKKVTVTLDGHNMELWMDNRRANIDGQETELGMAPQLLFNKAYVPAGEISKKLGLWVSWNGDYKKIDISRIKPCFSSKETENQFKKLGDAGIKIIKQAMEKVYYLYNVALYEVKIEEITFGKIAKSPEDAVLKISYNYSNNYPDGNQQAVLILVKDPDYTLQYTDYINFLPDPFSYQMADVDSDGFEEVITDIGCKYKSVERNLTILKYQDNKFKNVFYAGYGYSVMHSKYNCDFSYKLTDNQKDSKLKNLILDMTVIDEDQNGQEQKEQIIFSYDGKQFKPDKDTKFKEYFKFEKDMGN